VAEDARRCPAARASDLSDWQSFFVFVDVPGYTIFDDVAVRRLDRATEEANGIACVMPMRSDPYGPDLIPAASGWGLINRRDGKLLDPAALVDDELVEMSDWELQDFGTLVVRRHIEVDGGEVYSWQSKVGVDPSLWFRNGSLDAYVVVRCARYQDPDPLPSENLTELKRQIQRKTAASGFFAAVWVANAEDPFTSAEAALPLYRGHALRVVFDGLQRILNVWL
jgi:hypothetical protein